MARRPLKDQNVPLVGVDRALTRERVQPDRMRWERRPAQPRKAAERTGIETRWRWMRHAGRDKLVDGTGLVRHLGAGREMDFAGQHRHSCITPTVPRGDGRKQRPPFRAVRVALPLVSQVVLVSLKPGDHAQQRLDP